MSNTETNEIFARIYAVRSPAPHIARVDRHADGTFTARDCAGVVVMFGPTALLDRLEADPTFKPTLTAPNN